MASRETIHSGHFMASNVHEKFFEEEEEEIDVVSDGRLPPIEVTPDAKDEKPVTFYKFGPQTTRSIAIDTSLLKLNKCIQTAYAQLITPKWKFFKGLKLAWKERIRLNNVIWRAWHAQFVRNTQPKFCFFSVPEDDWHNDTEAAGLMEGIYWKRRMETVCAQYKRWRHFNFRRGSKTGGERRMRSRSMRHSNSDDDALLLPLPSLTPLSGLDDDDWSNWFTDTLFSSLSQPYLFPNPKEMAQAGNADFIQPGLVQLQPSLEEIMASLENDGPLSGYSDPALNISMTNNDVERMNDPLSEEASLESLRNSANQYTSKDYAAANLLVEYSNSMAGQSTSSNPGCSSNNDYSNRIAKSTAPMPLSTQGYDYRTVQQQRLENCDNQIYDSVSPRDSNAGAALCDPYVPQAATIETNTVQYTLAKTWLADSNGGNNGRVTTATAGRYEYANDPTPPAVSGPYSQMATTIQLLKSDPCVPRSLPLCGVGGGKEFSPSATSACSMPSVLPKRGRQASRKPTEKKGQKNKSVDVSIAVSDVVSSGPSSVASTAPTVVGIIESALNEPGQCPMQTTSAASRRRGSGIVIQRASGAGGTSATSSKRRASASLASLGEARQSGSLALSSFDYLHQSHTSDLLAPKSTLSSTPVSVDMSQQSQKLASLQPLVVQQSQQQQMGVVRPIPISLAARADSAFSAVSPTGFTPPSSVSHSPLQQRSPGSCAATPIDYSKTLVCTNDVNTATSFVSIGQPQLVYGGPTATASNQTQSSTQTPVLILQPFGGMQIPIMALPYSNSCASFTAATPKQEVDVTPTSPQDPDAYTSFGTDMSKNASQRGGAQQSLQRSGVGQRGNIKAQEQQAAQTMKKTAKRPADSTLDPSERKRVQHLHAEQSRRSALKGGFELLEDLLPEFNSTNTKPTNALVLLKSAERIRELKESLPNNEVMILRLKTEIQQMNEKISSYQKQLTVSGKSVSKVGMFQQMFESYVKKRTQQSWQFWLMKKVLDPVIDSYKTEVQGPSAEELLQSAIQWARKRCTKEELRPAVNSFLVQLGVETPLLKDPALFRQYVLEQIDK